MSTPEFDLLIIGGGSGGVRAARLAAARGLRTAVAEHSHWGGTCVNLGCIPKKLFSYAARFAGESRAAAGFGWELEAPQMNWSRLLNNKNQEIARLNQIYLELLRKAGVTILEGRASLSGPGQVRVAGREHHARRVLVATGSIPWIPDFPGREHVISSDQAFHLEQLPRRAIVVGGGYIATEFASIFKGLGVEARLVHRGKLPLKGFDHDLRGFVAEQLAAKGIELSLECEVERIARLPDGSLKVQTATAGELEADLVLYATGRRPNIAGLGLEALGVKLDGQASIVVDEDYCSNQPWLYALGDVIDRRQLTPVALAEAGRFVAGIFTPGLAPLDYHLVPSAVFSSPDLAVVGLSEEEARQDHPRLKIFRSQFRPLKQTLGGQPDQALVKVIVNEPDDRVLGIHMAGVEAAEIMQGLAVAMKAGLTKATLDATIGIHPTAAEEFVTLRSPVAAPVTPADTAAGTA